jgi:hypothetical protein
VSQKSRNVIGIVEYTSYNNANNGSENFYDTTENLNNNEEFTG